MLSSVLYEKNSFSEHGIRLKFLKMKALEYRQFGRTFIPSLSIIDVMMFNSRADIVTMLDEFDLN